MTLPLLIGGATTSKLHTAVKIDPCYNRGQTVYVPDASRAVGVASALLDDEQRRALSAGVKAEYREIAERAAARDARTPGLARAVARRTACRSTGRRRTAGAACGPASRVRRLRPRASSSRYIDWTPFFRTWELKGTFPRILDDATRRRGRALALRRRAGDARAARRRALGHGSGGRRALAGERRSATTSPSTRTRIAGASSRRCTRCASSSLATRRTRTSRWPTSSRRSTPASPTTSARSR